MSGGEPALCGTIILIGLSGHSPAKQNELGIKSRNNKARKINMQIANSLN
jgi:hypothetical protein